MSKRGSKYSAAAKAKRHRGSLAWGILFATGWVFATIGMMPVARAALQPAPGAQPNEFGAFLLTQVFVGVLLIVAIILLIIGVVGEVKSTKFNRRDAVLAHAMGDRLAALSTEPRSAMYAVDTAENADGSWDHRITDAIPLEVERHFDQQTLGSITGALQTRMSLFGTTVGIGVVNRRGIGFGGALTKGRVHGTTQADLTVNETTRANLMGDGLFSTYSTGEDSWRLIAMPNTAAQEWLYNLLLQLWHHFGSDETHTGRTVGSWVGPLTQTFTPSDVSYATDRLTHILSRPFEARPPVTFSGTLIGRNAILAAELTLPDGTRLEMLPIRLPARLAAAVLAAEADAVPQIEATGNAELTD